MEEGPGEAPSASGLGFFGGGGAGSCLCLFGRLETRRDKSDQKPVFSGAQAFNYSRSGGARQKEPSIHSNGSSGRFLSVLIMQQGPPAILNHSRPIVHHPASLRNGCHMAKIKLKSRLKGKNMCGPAALRFSTEHDSSHSELMLSLVASAHADYTFLPVIVVNTLIHQHKRSPNPRCETHFWKHSDCLCTRLVFRLPVPPPCARGGREADGLFTSTHPPRRVLSPTCRTLDQLGRHLKGRYRGKLGKVYAVLSINSIM